MPLRIAVIEHANKIEESLEHEDLESTKQMLQWMIQQMTILPQERMQRMQRWTH